MNPFIPLRMTVHEMETLSEIGTVQSTEITSYMCETATATQTSNGILEIKAYLVKQIINFSLTYVTRKISDIKSACRTATHISYIAYLYYTIRN